ncbi:MAG TPA: prolipoprotein diacylglyceryl transferase [Clostridiales bacterium]|nr:prolipoprotein diacylglyceryl transferase [Clostridiales bacterium]
MHYIEFPNLGIHIDLNPELFSIGSLQVHWYGIITALAFLVVVVGIIKSAPKFDLDQDNLIDMVLITVPAGILGARLFYVFINWGYYSANLSEIYKIWKGGLAIYGGIILGIITIYLFCRYKKINTLHLLDHISVYLLLGQVVGRWGNFVNQELFGPNTNLPWGMTGDIIKNTIIIEGFEGVNPELPVHPLFLYESLWNLAAFFILLWFRKRKKLNGEVFSLYMISYGGARFVIDSLRFDLRVGDVNINRLIGVIFIIGFTATFILRRLQLKKQSLEEPASEPSQYRNILDELNVEQESMNVVDSGEGDDIKATSGEQEAINQTESINEESKEEVIEEEKADIIQEENVEVSDVKEINTEIVEEAETEKSEEAEAEANEAIENEEK